MCTRQPCPESEHLLFIKAQSYTNNHMLHAQSSHSQLYGNFINWNEKSKTSQNWFCGKPREPFVISGIDSVESLRAIPFIYFPLLKQYLSCGLHLYVVPAPCMFTLTFW